MGQDNVVPRRINRVEGIDGQWMESRGPGVVEEWAKTLKLLGLIAGDGQWAGFEEEGTVGEDVSQWELVVLGPDGRWYLADATHCYKTGSDDRANGEGADHLIDDTNAQFEAADVGAIVWNTTDDTYAVVTVYNDQGDLTLSASIFVAAENYIIFRLVRGRLAIATEAITSGNTGTLFTKGFIRHDAWAWATIQGWVYVSATAGALTQTRPGGSNQGRRVGVAQSAGILWFNPDMIDYVEGARAYHSADQAISTETHTDLAFNQERYDTDNIHHNVTNNSRLTCKTAGTYAIVGNVIWDGVAGGVRWIYIKLNDTTTIAKSAIGAVDVNEKGMIVSTKYQLAVGDFVTLRVWHNQGGDVDVLFYDDYSPTFMMQREG